MIVVFLNLYIILPYNLQKLLYYTVAHKRKAKVNFLALKAYNSPTTSAKVIILYLF
jgi:hypothetical protein